jgi:carboxypeptidase Taq
MNQSQNDYSRLQQFSRTTRTLKGVSSLLEWDHETYLPPDAAKIRGSQLELLAGMVHERKTSNKMARLLDKLISLKTGKIKGKELSLPQEAALREWRRDYLKDTALPKKFVEEMAKLISQAVLVWREAKEKDAFQHYAPFLDKLVSMARKKADYLGYEAHPYDALLDEYEPDMTTKDISKLFSGLRQPIVALLKRIKRSKQPDNHFLFGSFPPRKQLKFGKRLLTDMGYEMSKGRLDLSTHPFSSSSHPTDNRITTRIHPSSLISSLSAILHEGGHALYEMNLPVEQYGSPLGEAISLGIHESQSRWWETRIGQSKPFWKHYLPLLQKEFKALEKVSLDQFYRAINKVETSLIRVEADEVTYTLHIILRYELEKALIEGKLPIREVPDAWNAKMMELLGITPKTNSEGCLQDVHWAMGNFGYFPTYALGNLYAAHLFEAFEMAHPDWEQRVAEGELLFINNWLKEMIHRHGRRFQSKELLKQVSRRAFSINSFIQYLTKKYSEIYV